jgi:hypothetical protein
VTEFAFSEPPNFGVFICEEVFAGAPVLQVWHESDGDWQFLCGDDHSDSEPRLVCLEDVVRRDATLNAIADLCIHHSATRERVGGPWTRIDEAEENIITTVEEYGWFIAMFPDDDDPGARFAYSIGMAKTLEHPEIIIVGQPVELMASMINDIGEQARRGEPFPIGAPVEGLIEGHSCVLQPMHPSHYDQWLGYGIWFHQGRDFQVLQCFWPDKAGKFPWDADYSYSPEQQQDLTKPATEPS